jgi:23S rRNA (uracil1939-C5)-methyltransferase
VRLVRERLELRPSDALADLYAGVGFFSKIFAGECRVVQAIEVSRQAADDAAVNLAGLENVQYTLGAVEAILPQLTAIPNKILLDPSREGCAPPVLEALIAAAPERLVYVSCDVATLARDLRRLVDGGFELLEVLPLDMFPQTYHIECIATLRRELA